MAEWHSILAEGSQRLNLFLLVINDMHVITRKNITSDQLTSHRQHTTPPTPQATHKYTHPP